MIEIKEEPIEIQKEFGGLMELCYFCRAHTRFWHLASNTPVCKSCAAIHDVSELPKKKVMACASNKS